MNAISALYGKVVDRHIDPLAEVLITSGASEALFDVIAGNIGEGDEVIIIEPFFDAYESVIKLAGGTIRHVPLKLVGSALFFGIIHFDFRILATRFECGKSICRQMNGKMG